MTTDIVTTLRDRIADALNHRIGTSPEEIEHRARLVADYSRALAALTAEPPTRRAPSVTAFVDTSIPKTEAEAETEAYILAEDLRAGDVLVHEGRTMVVDHIYQPRTNSTVHVHARGGAGPVLAKGQTVSILRRPDPAKAVGAAIADGARKPNTTCPVCDPTNENLEGSAGAEMDNFLANLSRAPEVGGGQTVDVNDAVAKTVGATIETADHFGPTIEIPDLATAREYVGRVALLGHRDVPGWRESSYDDAGICWSPSSGTLSIGDPRNRILITTIMAPGVTATTSRSIHDGVVIRLLDVGETIPEPPAEQVVRRRGSRTLQMPESTPHQVARVLFDIADALRLDTDATWAIEDLAAEVLCDARDEHERRADAYRDRLRNECRALPLGWQWQAVCAVVVAVTGDGSVALHADGTVIIDGASPRLILPATLLPTMRDELNKARKP